ncbi:MAG: leucyl/phenylalanyl-tRNA--protein transferase [Ignavibacteria bacterium]|nr:leucyl/phenylalanyl-tRNA--protein transferase [Ignavibacteria bacterium]
MGIFPMGEDDGSIAWYEASPRAIMPIEPDSSRMKISRSLKQVMKKEKFNITIDKAFNEVIKNCAARDTTWINELIISAFKDLHSRGFAHSIEAWDKDTGELAGGLYGVAYKGAFFGESMFRTVSNASKICVVKLYEILKQNNFILLDIQMMTNHFEQFGAIEVSKRSYLEILDRAMSVKREIVI